MEGGDGVERVGDSKDLQQQSKAVDKLTDRVVDRQLDSTRVQEAMASIAAPKEADIQAARLREKEWAAVNINAAEIDIIANELELDKKVAERTQVPISQPEIPISLDIEEIDEPTNSKNAQRPRWKEEENERLAMAWANASTSPKLGYDQTSLSFWSVVKSYFDHEVDPSWPERNRDTMRKHFIPLGRAIYKFQSKIEEAFLYKSGENDEMKFKQALQMYKGDVGVDFKEFKAWKVLKEQPKWKIWSESKYVKEGGDGGLATKKLKNMEGDSSPSPFSTPIDSPLADNTTDCETPTTKWSMGRKALKRGLKGGSSKEGEQGELLQRLKESDIERKNEYQHLLYATLGHYQRLEMEAKRQNEILLSDVIHKQAHREKRAGEREKKEEDRILSIDLDDPKLNAYLRKEYVLRKQQIITKRYG